MAGSNVHRGYREEDETYLLEADMGTRTGSADKMLSMVPHGTNIRRQPIQGGRAGASEARKQFNTRHWQPSKAAHSCSKLRTVHVLLRVSGKRWPCTHPTPARPDLATGTRHGLMGLSNTPHVNASTVQAATQRAFQVNFGIRLPSYQRLPLQAREFPC